MNKKLPPQDQDDALARAVRDSARQVWQAGLGAFARARDAGEGATGSGEASEVEVLKRRLDALEARLAELADSPRRGAD